LTREILIALTGGILQASRLFYTWRQWLEPLGVEFLIFGPCA